MSASASTSASKPKKKSTAKSITERLTDPKLYTGTHVNRFDEDGKGKGLAGRANLVDYTGSTNAKSIDNTAPAEKKKPVVTPGSLGTQKFGTQASKSITINLYRNGDKHHSGEKVVLKGMKTMDQLYDKASQVVKLTTGAVRKIYKKDLKTSVRTLDGFEDGGHYLCCGGEKPATGADRVPVKLLEA